jgi:hypothetical protein
MYFTEMYISPCHIIGEKTMYICLFWRVIENSIFWCTFSRWYSTVNLQRRARQYDVVFGNWINNSHRSPRRNSATISPIPVCSVCSKHTSAGVTSSCDNLNLPDLKHYSKEIKRNFRSFNLVRWIQSGQCEHLTNKAKALPVFTRPLP